MPCCGCGSEPPAHLLNHPGVRSTTQPRINQPIPSIEPLRLAALLALVVVLCGSLNAQTSRVSGGVQGVVIDESGGVVPGAAVTVEQPEKGFRRGAATDSRGRFLIQGLPSDHYTVRIEQDGFGTAVIEDLVVSLGHTLFQQVELRPAAVTESIEVTVKGGVNLDHFGGAKVDQLVKG